VLSDEIALADDNNALSQLQIAVTGLDQPGADELLVAGAPGPFALNTPVGAGAQTVTVGGVTYQIVIAVPAAGEATITFTENTGAAVTAAQMEALIEALSHNNTSQSPTATNRVFDSTVTDAGGAPGAQTASARATVDMSNAAVNDAPSLDLDADNSTNTSPGPGAPPLADQGPNDVTVSFTEDSGGVAVEDAELAEDALHVDLDRGLADTQRQRDFLIGLALGDEAKQVLLAPGQGGEGAAGLCRLQVLAHRLVGDIGAAGPHQPERLDQHLAARSLGDEAARPRVHHRQHVGMAEQARKHHHRQGRIAGLQDLHRMGALHARHAQIEDHQPFAAVGGQGLEQSAEIGGAHHLRLLAKGFLQQVGKALADQLVIVGDVNPHNGRTPLSGFGLKLTGHRTLHVQKRGARLQRKD
jgi:hypothetical protein